MDLVLLLRTVSVADRVAGETVGVADGVAGKTVNGGYTDGNLVWCVKVKVFSCQAELQIWCLEADEKLCSVVYEVLELELLSCSVEVAVVELKLSTRCASCRVFKSSCRVAVSYSQAAQLLLC